MLSYKDLVEETAQALEANGILSVDALERFKQSVGPTVSLHPSELFADPRTQCSKIGGIPNALAPNMWPVGKMESELTFPMTFVAQLDLSQMPSGLSDVIPLPSLGWLSFFVNEHALFGGKSGPPCAVIYSQELYEARQHLQVAQGAFQGFLFEVLLDVIGPDEKFLENSNGMTPKEHFLAISANYATSSVFFSEAHKTWAAYPCVPVQPRMSFSFSSIHWGFDVGFGVAEPDAQSILKVRDQLLGIECLDEFAAVPSHKMGGIPDASNVTTGGKYGHYPSWLNKVPDAESAISYQDGAADDPYILLLQLDTMEIKRDPIPAYSSMTTCKLMMWGNMADLKFFARRSDLLKADFSKTICVVS